LVRRNAKKNPFSLTIQRTATDQSLLVDHSTDGHRPLAVFSTGELFLFLKKKWDCFELLRILVFRWKKIMLCSDPPALPSTASDRERGRYARDLRRRWLSRRRAPASSASSRPAAAPSPPTSLPPPPGASSPAPPPSTLSRSGSTAPPHLCLTVGWFGASSVPGVGCCRLDLSCLRPRCSSRSALC
jgi:hypothetical protein